MNRYEGMNPLDRSVPQMSKWEPHKTAAGFWSAREVALTPRVFLAALDDEQRQALRDAFCGGHADAELEILRAENERLRGAIAAALRLLPAPDGEAKA